MEEIRDVSARLEKVPFEELSSQAETLFFTSREKLSQFSQCVEQCGEKRRREVERRLNENNVEVREYMKKKFENPPNPKDTVLWEDYNPKVLPADDLEQRLDATLQRAGHRPSVANCLRSCSERVYFLWGMTCLTTLCWLMGIARTASNTAA